MTVIELTEAIADFDGADATSVHASAAIYTFLVRNDANPRPEDYSPDAVALADAYMAANPE